LNGHACHPTTTRVELHKNAVCARAQYNEAFLKQQDKVALDFVLEFAERFSNQGRVDWVKLVEHNSGNFELSDFSAQ
jgi:hypothetical protein